MQFIQLSQSVTMIALAVVSVLVLVGSQAAEGYSISTNDTAVKPSALSCSGIWSIPVDEKNGSLAMGCKCGYGLGGLVLCDRASQVHLHLCYCLTAYAKDPKVAVVGPCTHKCQYSRAYDNDLLHYNSIPSNVSVTELSNYTCSISTSLSSMQSLNREGQLCGKCKKGFAPPAYSYDWRCMNCSLNDTSWKKQWAAYFAIVYLPLTAFFVVILMFRINTTSPSLNAFVLISQVAASPIVIKACNGYIHPWSHTVRAAFSLYGFWNLDFFRILLPPFCLHPNMSTLQVLALDYGIAVYPLLLIVITYALVELHDHDFKIVVWLWKPFHRCFVSFKRQWNIRASLIDAFVSFLQLSYVKFLIVSFYFLFPTHLYKADGHPVKESYLLYDATIEYFSRDHLPYAILAIVVLSVVNILPMLLLCFYPCSWFQKCLNCCRLSHQALHTFMDAFQGYYKNGTDGTRDCRWFSGVYFAARIAIFFIALVVPTTSLFALFSGIFLLVPLTLTAIVQPYKVSFYNSVDVWLFLSLALFCFSAVGGLLVVEGGVFVHTASKWISLMLTIFGTAPLIYIFMVALYYLFLRSKILQQWFSKVWSLVPCRKLSSRWNCSEELLPERLSNPEECAALLQEPLDHGQDTYGSTRTSTY